MRHWESLGGQPIGGSPLSGPRKEEIMKPWTWEEIAKLRGKARASFIKTYGARAKAALVASDHPPGEYTSAVNCYGFWHPEHRRRSSLGWECGECPLDCCGVWRRRITGSCSASAMLVYARMVKELGLLPEEEKP